MNAHFWSVPWMLLQEKELWDWSVRQWSRSGQEELLTSLSRNWRKLPQTWGFDYKNWTSRDLAYRFKTLTALPYPMPMSIIVQIFPSNKTIIMASWRGGANFIGCCNIYLIGICQCGKDVNYFVLEKYLVYYLFYRSTSYQHNNTTI
jgi:hypothetical protein